MNFEYTETQQLIRETARKFAEEKLAPSSIERDEHEVFPYEAIKELGELGFMGMMVPEVMVLKTVKLRVLEASSIDLCIRSQMAWRLGH